MKLCLTDFDFSFNQNSMYNSLPFLYNERGNQTYVLPFGRIKQYHLLIRLLIVVPLTLALTWRVLFRPKVTKLIVQTFHFINSTKYWAINYVKHWIYVKLIHFFEFNLLSNDVNLILLYNGLICNMVFNQFVWVK